MIAVGSKVRVYYGDDFFDEGEIVSVDGCVIVDFYDWIQRWELHEFRTIAPLGLEVLEPTSHGVLVREFRPNLPEDS